LSLRDAVILIVLGFIAGGFVGFGIRREWRA
jgi:hypothetical protein